MRMNKAAKAVPLIALLSSLLSFPASAQISGCTDPAATNYNAAATVNDGSCLYHFVTYTPVVKVDPLSSTINETSALQFAGNYLWTLNDGGGAAAIYRMDTATNALLQTVNLGGAFNGDWEALAFDGTHLYIGAVGNNVNGARTNLRVYKLPLSAIPDHIGNPTVTIPSEQIEVISFTYSDQPQPPEPTATNSTAFDCAAMFVDGGKIHLFSKNWLANNTTHYVINSVSAGSYVATPVETLETGYLVTAADKAPGSDLVVLMGYKQEFPADHFMHLLSGYSNGLYFNGNKRKVGLPNASVMGQAEGFAFRTNSYGYISNERVTGNIGGFTYTVTQKLHTFNLEAFMPAIVLPLTVKRFDVGKMASGNRLQWQFALPVRDLQVQVSTDRIQFTPIQTYPNASEGALLHQPATASACYRLAWKTAQGSLHYSAVKCVDNTVSSLVSNAVLSRNGELLFTKNGGEAGQFTLRLLTTDGKLLAQKTGLQLATGTNRVRFEKVLTAQSVIVLEIIQGEDRSALLLPVQ